MSKADETVVAVEARANKLAALVADSRFKFFYAKSTHRHRSEALQMIYACDPSGLEAVQGEMMTLGELRKEIDGLPDSLDVQLVLKFVTIPPLGGLLLEVGKDEEKVAKYGRVWLIGKASS